MAFICCICQDHILQHNTKRHNGKKAIMNTTRGDQTDNVVNMMNNVKLVITLVIIGDEGFMAPLFNTTKRRHNNKKTRENTRRE